MIEAGYGIYAVFPGRDIGSDVEAERYQVYGIYCGIRGSTVREVNMTIFFLQEMTPMPFTIFSLNCTLTSNSNRWERSLCSWAFSIL
ncbi:hypothetical protein M5K25_021817 [Dendrobium thyrsiflorum]|uniref:Uncharacterized protein n=1 Tax=Dendrobium thyrsiflorum TaxID=117978 RepID=A0ABD0UAJ1_DENTH